MARDDRSSDKGKVRVRVIEFDMEGSNQTLKESIRDIVGAIGRAQIRPPTGPKTLPGAGVISNGQASVDEEPLETEADDAFDQEDASEVNESTTRRRSPPRSPLVLDIDLKQGPIALSDFLTRVAPDSDNLRYTSIAYWLKTYAAIGEVTADHIHTGYREMKWNTPADASQPLRKLKTRQYGYMRSGSKPGTFVLIHIGDNAVRDLMKKAGLDE